MATVIENVRIFDGETVLEESTVLIDDNIIVGINGDVPEDALFLDGTGQTLLPGLIESHVHVGLEENKGLTNLHQLLTFGITTAFDMASHDDPKLRATAAEYDVVADLRSALVPLTAPTGHPLEVIRRMHPEMDVCPEPWPPCQHNHKQPDDSAAAEFLGAPMATTPDEARLFVQDRVADGSDFIKLMVEDGLMFGEPGLPLPTNDTLAAGIDEAHRHGKLAVCHAMTQATTAQCLDAGADGLAHMFADGLISPELIKLLQDTGAFICATACLIGSLMGIRPSIADDARVAARLPKEWNDTLQSSFDTYHPAHSFAEVLQSLKAMHDAGIDLLVGTDSTVPTPAVGGLALGASVHHEMQLFVDAGLSPMAALKAATSVPARRFGLDDRGRIAPGLRADLLLVDGDPTNSITDTLNIRTVWRRGRMLAL